MKIIKGVAAVLALCAAMTGAAAAQQGTYLFFSPAQINSLLTGDSSIEIIRSGRLSNNNMPYWLVRHKGAPMVLNLWCSSRAPDRCIGGQIYTHYGSAVRVPLTTVNALNRTVPNGHLSISNNANVEYRQNMSFAGVSSAFVPLNIKTYVGTSQILRESLVRRMNQVNWTPESDDNASPNVVNIAELRGESEEIDLMLAGFEGQIDKLDISFSDDSATEEMRKIINGFYAGDDGAESAEALADQ